MVDVGALHSNSNALVPSQVRQQKKIHKDERLSHAKTCRLVPSQVLSAHASEGMDDERSQKTPPSPRIKDNPSHPDDQNAQVRDVRGGNDDDSTKRRRRRNRRKTPLHNAKAKKQNTGNLPDVQWRSIPMEHLRHHPNFVPLPLPTSIRQLESLEDVRQFRQESWQWDALHTGRCTTSQAAAALGFLEPKAGEFLKVPRAWRRGGQGAYYRLAKPALRTLEEMNDILCDRDDDHDSNSTDHAGESNRYWRVTPDFPFAAKYAVQVTEKEFEKRRHQAKVYVQAPGIEWSIRMMWGNTQEATSLLTALNYFWEQDSGIVLKEVGMCGAGLALNNTAGASSTGLLVGATPDGLLVHPDGTMEVVEVKNHCPFQPNFKRDAARRARQPHGRFRLSRMELTPGVVPQYISQLMMEMLCVGPACKSAIMVRQTAVNGALILRMHRDDEWIEEMLYWLNRFHDDFVEQGKPPPTDFFYQSDNIVDRDRYLSFLEKTRDLESRVEVVSHVPHNQVQRATGAAEFTNLFLD